MIIDTHAHIDQLENTQEALERAVAEGVAGVVAISMNLQSCRDILKLKQTVQAPKIFIGMGMHPSDAKLDDLSLVVDMIRQNVSELTCVGEIGLDFWYKWVRKDAEKKAEQRQVFETLLALAQELDLPAVIHSRGCWRECFETAQRLSVTKAEFHWYSGPLDVLDDILAAGYYVSTSPSVASSPQSREAMAHAPIEQTLIETDCPVYYKNRDTGEGFKAEPKDVYKTLNAYAELKNLDRDQALQILNQNACRFFQLDLDGS